MTRDTQSRKWQLTINNPLEKGFTHEVIKESISQLKSVSYYCMADEAGQTHHTHIFISCTSGLRFSTIKNKFATAHLEVAKGTSQQNRDYILKAGKWEKDAKHGTVIPGTFEEMGELPVERQGKRNDLEDLYDLIKSGASNYEIMENTPEHLLHIDKIDRARLAINAENYKETFRKLEVTYMFGATGTGKTRKVLETHGYRNVYRVTNYKHPFDQYEGQDILVLDEYRSNFPIGDLLNYLDGYPLQLPCRYNNRQACYTKVYIISNICFEKQYPELREKEPASWEALKRRIHHFKKVEPS